MAQKYSSQLVVADMVYCPFASWSALVVLLDTAIQHHVFPDQYHYVLKRDAETPGEVWKGIDWPQVLGLGFEQVLKCLVATESTDGIVLSRRSWRRQV